MREGNANATTNATCPKASFTLKPRDIQDLTQAGGWALISGDNGLVGQRTKSCCPNGWSKTYSKTNDVISSMNDWHGENQGKNVSANFEYQSGESITTDPKARCKVDSSSFQDGTWNVTYHNGVQTN